MSFQKGGFCFLNDALPFVQHILIVFDGLEPLQHAENLQSMNGELQDSALKEFIACFRQTAGKSFVLFSSRQPLVELKKWQAEHFLSLAILCKLTLANIGIKAHNYFFDWRKKCHPHLTCL